MTDERRVRDCALPAAVLAAERLEGGVAYEEAVRLLHAIIAESIRQYARLTDEEQKRVRGHVAPSLN